MQNAPNPQKKIVRDAKGRRFVLGNLLGRGSFGKVYRAEDEESGEIMAAKLPLAVEDLANDDQSAELLELYGRLVRDEGGQLKKLPEGLGPVSFNIVDGGAVPCLLEDYFEDSLLERLHAHLTFEELCGALILVCEALGPLHASGRGHGNLKPGNIFFVEGRGGRIEVRFTDPVTSSYLNGLSLLATRQPALAGWFPPELLERDGSVPPVTDTFALAKLLYVAVVEPDASASFSGKVGPFEGGIDKAAITRFRGALAQRLLEDNSNPHVRDLLIRRATAFLNRALSVETAPSPPYRFYSAAEMAARLAELQELFHPGFAQLGMVLLDDPTRANNVFTEGEEIRFSLSFRCHGGLEDVDLITCMTYVRDLNEDQKVKDAGIEVSPHHDGNRFRFSFRIPYLRPGRYLVRIALAVKGSPGKPTPRDLTIEVTSAASAMPRPPTPHETPSARRDPQPESSAAPPETRAAPAVPPAPAAPPLPARDARPSAQDAVPAALRPATDRKERPAAPASAKSDGAGKDASRPAARAGANLGAKGAEAALKSVESRVSGGSSRSEQTDDRKEDWFNTRDPSKGGRDLVWMAEDDRQAALTAEGRERSSSRPQRDVERGSAQPPADRAARDEGTVRPLQVNAGDDKARSRVEPRDMDDVAVRYRIEPRDMDDKPARGRSEPRDLDERPVKPRLEPRDLDDGPPLSGRPSGDLDAGPRLRLERPDQVPEPRRRGRGSDDTLEMEPTPPTGGPHGLLRTRLEAAPVGRDAARHATGGVEASPEPRRDTARRPPTPVIGPAADRARTGSAPAADTGRDGADDRSRPADGSRWKSSFKRGDAEVESGRSGGERGGGDRGRGADASSQSGKPGEQFIPELYYKEARTRPMPGEEDDAFFKRGAMTPQQYAVVIGVLGSVLIGLVALILWLVF